MKLLLLLALSLNTMVACASEKAVKAPPPLPPSAAEEKVEAPAPPAPKPQPIEIAGETPGISVDPVTLAITWEKGADPKQVGKSLLKLWIQSQNQLNQCQQQMQFLNSQVQGMKK